MPDGQRFYVSTFSSLVRPVAEEEGHLSLPDLCELLTTPAYLVGDAKWLSPAWAPTKFAQGRRGNVNVEEVSCLVLDYDQGTLVSETKRVWADYFYIFHTTRSHAWLNPRYRLVLPLAVPVSREEHYGLWYWAYIKTGKKIDKACKDPSRVWLLPSVDVRFEQTEMDFRAFNHEGQLLNSEIAGPLRKAFNRTKRRAPRLQGIDAKKRMTLGRALGGTINESAVRFLECPGCGRSSVWYWIDPHWVDYAQCKRKHSCAWAGTLEELAGMRRPRVKRGGR